MAKKDDKPKTVLERTYTVPLRRGYQMVAKWRRSKKAVNVLRAFLQKHMKATEVKIGKYANLEIWKHGIKNPPHHIKVMVTKDDKGTVFAELVGAPKEEKVEEKKKKAIKKAEGKAPTTEAPKKEKKGEAEKKKKVEEYKKAKEEEKKELEKIKEI